MAATLELKYFNSFWIKKMDSIMNVRDTTGVVSSDNTGLTITLTVPNLLIGVGQRVTNNSITQSLPDFVYVVAVNSDVITVNKEVTVLQNEVLKFGPIQEFKDIPRVYPSTDASDWYAEESRIRGGYNNTNVDLGVKAYIVEDDLTQNHRSNSLIYSGIFNSRTGVNNTNQFSVADSITRAVDPSNGSIQKLYAEDTNLIVFQEEKVNRALIDKDAIYTAEGGLLTTAGNDVIGQIVPYAGNFGISTNPESFATYGYRKYFTDRVRNAVLRLSQDGLTEISNYGMYDYFRDGLNNVGNAGRVIGGWDMHTKSYVLSMQHPSNTIRPEEGFTFSTLAFDEQVLGWTSRFSYKPDLMGSLRNNFYTNKNGELWLHYSNSNRATFYNTTYASSVSFVWNSKPSSSKVFKTINYEGSPGWKMFSAIGNTSEYASIEGISNPPEYQGDQAFQISNYVQPTSLADLETSLFVNKFKRREDKYFANILNISTAVPGEVLFGQSMTGIKGFYATVKMVYDTDQQSRQGELFAVSTNYVESSY